MRLRSLTHLALGLPLITGACGFSFLSDRATNPVITDYQSEHWGFAPAYGVLSTTAGRRSIFIRYPGNDDWLPDVDLNKHLNGKPRICSEPPPDAVDAYANALAVAAKGSSPSGVSGGLDISRTFAVSSALGLHRTQGLQLLRDRSFSNCMMFIQGFITKEQWISRQDKIEADAERLIEREIPYIGAVGKYEFQVVNAPSVSGGKTVSATEQTKPNAPKTKPGAEQQTMPSADKNKASAGKDNADK